MGNHRLRNLVSDCKHWIETRHRFLEDHADLLAPIFRHLIPSEIKQILSVEQDVSAINETGWFGKQLHDGKSRHRLTTARFSHDRPYAAGLQRKVNPVNCPSTSTRSFEIGA